MTKHCVQHVAVVGVCLQVVLACVIIPLWLLVVRQLVRQQQPIHAAVAAVAGMVLLLTAEVVHSSAAAGDQAASWAVATPASISAMMGKEVGSEVHRALLSTCIHQQLEACSADCCHCQHMLAAVSTDRLLLEHEASVAAPLFSWLH